ncbi:MAG: CHC2 zinc finger domain-containing protein [Nanoarchaeota archaeon]
MIFESDVYTPREHLKILLQGYPLLVKNPPRGFASIFHALLVKHMEEDINQLTRLISPPPVYEGGSIKEFKEKYLFKETVEGLIKVNRMNKALCLFHQDKNPSMHIYDDHFYCFSCGERGDIITFLTKFYNISISELLNKYVS